MKKNLRVINKKSLVLPELNGVGVFEKTDYVNPLIANHKPGYVVLPTYLLRTDQTKK